jgi:hypothetical protein
MNLRFYIDPERDEPHFARHGVTAEEVREVLERPRARYRGSREALIVVGQSDEGRWLQVIFVEDPEPNSYFVITAYPPRPALVRAIRRKR